MITCPYCNGRAILKDATVVYGSSSNYGKLYVCENFPKCDSYVGAYPNGNPKGRLANKKLMNKSESEAHIGKFDVRECQILIKKLKDLNINQLTFSL